MAWVEFSDSTVEKQRIGIIGTSFGMNHVQSATIVPEAKLVAACDLRDEFRAPIEGWAPSSIPTIAVCSTLRTRRRRRGITNHLHAPISIDCMERGCQ